MVGKVRWCSFIQCCGEYTEQCDCLVGHGTGSDRLRFRLVITTLLLVRYLWDLTQAGDLAGVVVQCKQHRSSLRRVGL